jgi:threonine dehydrogenase-like Zn-dependent dehydrogenase
LENFFPQAIENLWGTRQYEAGKWIFSLPLWKKPVLLHCWTLTMKAFAITNPGQSEIQEIEKPEPNEDEALLRIHKVGFCGGDLNAYRGTFPMQQYPMIIGHEVGATIEAVGQHVPDEFAVGTKVTLNPYQAGADDTDDCLPCRRGLRNAAVDNRTMGVRRPGAMTDYITVPHQKLYCSDKLSHRELALVEPLTVGFHATNRGQVAAGEFVMVFGCGIVGLGAVSGAAVKGANVIAVDIDDQKLEVAKKAGAKYTINSLNENLHNRQLEITGGDGPIVCIEAVGLPATFRACVEEVAFTGRVVYIGYAKEGVEYDTKLFVQKELNIFGSRNALTEFHDVIAMLETGGKFPVEEVISRTVRIDEAPRAMADWAADPSKIIKMMLELD